MTENLLRKEFKEKDVNRIRNLVKKNFSERTTIGLGYEKKQEDHVEGDVWEEGGKTWTIKSGIKQNIPKLYQAKKAAEIPLRCPKCGGPMKHWLAKKMYKIHGFCFDPCTVEYEHNLKLAGLYDQYEKRMIQGNIREFIKDIESWVLESLNETSDYVTEQGDVERWSNISSEYKRKILENLKGYTDLLREHLKE